MGAFEELAEGCIAAVLCRTTPVDVGRLSLVSKTFRSAADSDEIWDRFLRSDPKLIADIISQFPSLANATTKRAFYLALSNHPILNRDGRMVYYCFLLPSNLSPLKCLLLMLFDLLFYLFMQSVQLDRKSGKKCYMLAARSLSVGWAGVAWEDFEQNRNWTSMPDSRFPLNFSITCLLN